ncbi:MAG: hypothetical protein ABI380_05450, partial [Edaphobacter sp.]
LEAFLAPRYNSGTKLHAVMAAAGGRAHCLHFAGSCRQTPAMRADPLAQRSDSFYEILPSAVASRWSLSERSGYTPSTAGGHKDATAHASPYPVIEWSSARKVGQSLPIPMR